MGKVPCDWIGLRSTGTAKGRAVPKEPSPNAAGAPDAFGVVLSRVRKTVALSDVYEPGSAEWCEHLDRIQRRIRKRYRLTDDMRRPRPTLAPPDDSPRKITPPGPMECLGIVLRPRAGVGHGGAKRAGG